MCFDRVSNSAFLGNPLQLIGNDDWTYHQLRPKTYDFNDEEVATRCHLLYFLLKEDYSIDVAKIIFYDIYKFVKLEVNQNKQKAKGSLRFPMLITTLYAAHGVEVNPTVKIRPIIDQKFILHNCTNTKEQPPQVGDAPFH